VSVIEKTVRRLLKPLANLVLIIAARAKPNYWMKMPKALEQWLNKGIRGNIQYMENHFDLRG
jgi:hypothetical protein